MRAIQKTKNDVPLYRLEAYRTLGGWQELLHRVGIVFLLMYGTVGIIFLSISNATTGIRPYDVIFTSGFCLAVSVFATAFLIGMNHPNEWVNRVVSSLPIVVIGVIILFG